MKKFLVLIAVAALTSACSQHGGGDHTTAAAPTETAQEFVDRINAEYADWWRELSSASWVYATYINDDSAVVRSKATERYAAWHSAAVEAAKFVEPNATIVTVFPDRMERYFSTGLFDNFN